MPRFKIPRIPKYRHHKTTDRAMVSFDGQDIYLGRFNSPESHLEYNNTTASFMSG